MEKYTRKKYSAGGLNWQKYPTKKVRGLYEIKGDGIDSKVNIVFFEKYDDEFYSLYPLEKNKDLFKEILVKSSALNSLDKGISVKGETDNGTKVSIKRVGSQDFSYAVGGRVNNSKKTILKYGDIKVEEPEFEPATKGMFTEPAHYKIRISNNSLDFKTEKEAKEFYNKAKNIENKKEWEIFFNKYLLSKYPQRAYILRVGNISIEELGQFKVGAPYSFSIETFYSVPRGTYFKFTHDNFGQKRVSEFVYDQPLNDRVLGWLKIGSDWEYGDWLYYVEGRAVCIGSGAETLKVKEIILAPNKFTLPKNDNSKNILNKDILKNLIDSWNLSHNREKKSDYLLDLKKQREDFQPLLEKLTIDGVPLKIQAMVIMDGQANRRKKSITKEQVQKIIENIWNNFYNDDTFSFGGGVGLKGNKSRIDMNHNDKIDADDFTILRNSMNGAWRNEHKHVNSTSTKNGKVIDYEVKYARKHNPSRKGYKGKSFANGGALSNGSINYLTDLWFAVQQKDTDDYKMLAENLDKLNVPFSIQNEVSADAETQRGRKALNIPEVHDRIKKIVEKHGRNFAYGGGLKNSLVSGTSGRWVTELPNSKYKIIKEVTNAQANGKNNVTYNNIILPKDSIVNNLRGGVFVLSEKLKEKYPTIYNEKYGLPIVRKEEILNQIYKNSEILEYSKGGAFEKLSNRVAKEYVGDAVAPKYQRNYGKRYDKEEAKEVGNKIVGKMVSMGMDKKALGGLFGKSSIISTPKVSLDEKQVRLNTGEWVQVLDHSGNTLMVMDLNKLGSGAVPKRVNISEVDMTSFMAGGKVKSKPTTKKSSGSTKRGGAMQLAKEIRKEGEKWTDAVKRASAQLKK